MHQRNADGIYGQIRKRQQMKCIKQGICDKEHGCADDVERNMNRSDSLCVFIYADTRNQRGYAGADVLSHDNRQRHTVGDVARERQCLQYTDRRSR